jgi:RNA polymerase sigma-B factor
MPMSVPGNRETDDVARLFEKLRRTGDPDLRAALIERHLPLARSLASRYRYTPQPLEDLVQVASLGLVKAVDGFDPDRGTAFATYAVPAILGELRHHMRDTGWTVHVPRGTKELVGTVDQAERRLSARLGRAPTAAQLAEESGLGPEAVLEALTARVAQDSVPLDEPTGPGASTHADALGSADPLLGAVEERVSLSGPLRALAPRERTILYLRFVEGRTQTEIARRVGLSQMQVSRLLRSTLESLRRDLAEGD